MNTRLRQRLALLSLVLAGCLPPGGASMETEGTYDVQGRWAVGAPLADGRSPGEMTSQLLVEIAVESAPIPSYLEGEAENALDAAIGDWLAGRIDDNIPAEIEAGLIDTLGATLAEIDVESTLVLNGNLRGVETLDAISITHDGVRHDLLPYDLAHNGALTIEWNGDRRDRDEIALANHELTIQYVALFRFAIDAMFGGGKYDSLVSETEAAVPCGELSSIEIHVGGTDFEISTGILRNACAFAREDLLDRLFARYELALMTTGGSVRAFDDDGDDYADRLVSDEGFGGTLEIPYVPNAVSPVLQIDFEATRR